MCFSLAWIEQLLIWLVIVVAVVALLRLLLPWLLNMLGVGGGIIMQAINILVWAVVAIFVIYFIFAIISCLFSLGGGLPLFPHR